MLHIYAIVKKKGRGTMDIMSEIKNLPNLGYDYCKDNGKFCFVVLGGNPCSSTDEYYFYKTARRYICKLLELYEKKPFSEGTKDEIVHCMQKIRSACDGRMPGTYTLEQQTAYIDALSDDERDQIEEQVMMYKECHAIYRECYRQK